ncbi:sphingosine-1-phosphate phosphatase 1-like [Polyodon spathula]|uniref:sphingosine-1-phosphate phosphatase 1-like n=1 Tax=Polyodon spathula TaxID=7913 RepID=UPI001B7E3392|nr:sphingosine-1-phosphate phosphatase 1-like [Polyodon spathula]
MEIKSGILQLCEYLQDPYKVAKFQELCGVKASFNGKGENVREKEPGLGVHSGNCNNHSINKNEKGGEERKDQSNCPRQRKPATSGNNVKQGGCKNCLVAGTTVAGAGDFNKQDESGCGSPMQSSDGFENYNISYSDLGTSTTASSCSFDDNITSCDIRAEEKKKPLRKNSLTGEAGQEFVIGNRALYYMFTFGTELGNELFYITFFPFFIWNIDAYVSRRLIVIWVWVMYLGQCTKDVIRWSRPASPPVVKVEMFYNSEYSMPSTHAMSGTAIPFSLFLLTYGRWEYPFMFGLLLALCWCSLVCTSRIYMGMHSILDVIAGFLYSILILVVFQPALEIIDNFNLTCTYAPLIIISLHLAMGLFSFTLDTWSTSRGDTAEILGTGAGVACASHLNYALGLMPDPPLELLPFSPPTLTAGLVGKSVLRFVLGILILFVIRAVMKALTIPLACKIFRIPCQDIQKARQRMEVELPYRYITYGTVGFSALFLVPCIFSYLRLS